MSCSDSCIFSGQSSNASSGAVRASGGMHAVAAYGTFGGGTVTIEGSMDGGSTWFPIKAITAAGLYVIPLPIGKYRATLSGSSGASITVQVYRDGDVNVVFP